MQKIVRNEQKENVFLNGKTMHNLIILILVIIRGNFLKYFAISV